MRRRHARARGGGGADARAARIARQLRRRGRLGASRQRLWHRACSLRPQRLTRPRLLAAAQAHALELALAAGSEPVSGADTLRDLIVVAGHAVFTGTNFADAGDQDSWCARVETRAARWARIRGGLAPARPQAGASRSCRLSEARAASRRRFLEEYQRVPGQVATFLEHMQVRALAPARPAGDTRALTRCDAPGWRRRGGGEPRGRAALQRRRHARHGGPAVGGGVVLVGGQRARLVRRARRPRQARTRCLVFCASLPAALTDDVIILRCRCVSTPQGVYGGARA